MIVYVLSNPAMPGLVKIGLTTREEVDSRMQELYGSGVPFPFRTEFAANVGDRGAEVENALHLAFGPQRVNPKREFFRIDPEQAIAILRLLHVNGDESQVVDIRDVGDESENAAAESYRKRRPNLNFVEMGIPVGSELQFARGDQTVTVTGPKKVVLDGVEMTLSTATRQLFGSVYNVAPQPHWLFEGKLLQDIYEETYPIGE